MYKDNIFIEESEKLINSSLISDEVETKSGIKISKVTLDSKSAKLIGKTKGKYITITFDKTKVSNNIEELIEEITSVFKELKEYLKIQKRSKTLFVGLGNKEVTSDKFGYLTIEKIEASNKIFKIYKDTEGVTNIKSVDFIRAVSDITDPDLVIVFDSLKAEHLSRLGNTIQFSTGAIYPGSATSSKVRELSKRTIKRNIICVGVPTIINMKDINLNSPNILVSVDDVDKVVDNMSSLIGVVINRLF